MTTFQIITIGSVFIVDFILSVILPVTKHDDFKLSVLQYLRMIFCYTMMFALCVVLNEEQKRNEGKCPTLERVENVYKIKQ